MVIAWWWWYVLPLLRTVLVLYDHTKLPFIIQNSGHLVDYSSWTGTGSTTRICGLLQPASRAEGGPLTILVTQTSGILAAAEIMSYGVLATKTLWVVALHCMIMLDIWQVSRSLHVKLREVRKSVRMGWNLVMDKQEAIPKDQPTRQIPKVTELTTLLHKLSITSWLNIIAAMWLKSLSSFSLPYSSCFICFSYHQHWSHCRPANLYVLSLSSCSSLLLHYTLKCFTLCVSGNAWAI